MLPELSNCQPGWLMNTFIIRHAIAEGLDAVDFLSGDQAYKAHLGAKPTPMHQLSIAAPRPLAWLRHRLLLGSQRLKHWLISQSSV